MYIDCISPRTCAYNLWCSVLFLKVCKLRLITGRHLKSHGGVARTEYCKVFFLKPTACRSEATRMPKGGIWFGLRSKGFVFTVKNCTVRWIKTG